MSFISDRSLGDIVVYMYISALGLKRKFCLLNGTFELG